MNLGCPLTPQAVSLEKPAELMSSDYMFLSLSQDPARTGGFTEVIPPANNLSENMSEKWRSAVTAWAGWGWLVSAYDWPVDNDAR